MTIIISNTSGIPIYEQIKEQIKKSIVTGETKEGEMLPSTRHLATQLRISVITTMRAYAELEKDNLISAMQGKGYFVKILDKTLLYEKSVQNITQHLKIALTEARYADIKTEKLKDMLDELTKENQFD